MIYAILFILGLSLGSFTNALVWRVHEQSKAKKKRVASDKELSITTGRSMCTHCQHGLAWYDLMPLLSWLLLKGRCRYCHKPIGWHYPLVELSVALLFIFSYAVWPLGWSALGIISFGFWLTFLTGFAALFVYDLRWMILPNRIVFTLQVIALLFVFTQLVFAGDKRELLLGVALAVLSSAGVFYAIFQVSKGKWIGGGDVKLAVVLGLILGGPAKVALMLFIASMIGTCISLPLLLTGKFKRTSRMPFGPLLIIGTVIVYLFGATILDWYKRQLFIV